jgi:hypothetical protein
MLCTEDPRNNPYFLFLTFTYTLFLISEVPLYLQELVITMSNNVVVIIYKFLKHTLNSFLPLLS